MDGRISGGLDKIEVGMRFGWEDEADKPFGKVDKTFDEHELEPDNDDESQGVCILCSFKPDVWCVNVESLAPELDAEEEHKDVPCLWFRNEHERTSS